MRFTSPLILLLLLLLPALAWIGWPAPGPSRRRAIAALVLRLLIAVCLVLSLAGVEAVRSGDELAVVFLVDVSDSMPPEAVAAEMGYLRAALDAMGPDDQAAVVLFGADALVERAMRPGGELGQVTSAPVTTHTDLAGAIRLGLALFPPGAARRMLILSDGAQTSGDALKEARFAAASGVQILVVPFLGRPGSDALVTAVDVPTRLRPGEQFDLDVSIQSGAPQRSLVRVTAGDQILGEQEFDLRRGTQMLSLPLTAGEPGFVRYQVQIVPAQDGYYQNNRLEAFSQVEGPPRILLVAPPAGESLPGGDTRPDESSAIVRALQAAGFTVTVATPGRLPSDLPALAQYNAVVLIDVPARSLGRNQMLALQSYVRDLGGGLVAVGGPTSYGVGGYYGTPLEEALPVEMQIKDEQRRPSLAIVFIVDHSGSMSESSGGVEKLELAKEAAARSIELLFPTDRVGVIAFDETASWVVPMTDLSDTGAVVGAIGTIRSGGGTDILAGLQAMARVLPGDPARVKHVILLTDGGADPAGIPELVERLNREHGITLSTVAVGRDAAPFLEELAELGGGRYHFTVDAGSIPSIFTEETTLATRAYIVEESFLPERVRPSPILAGLQGLPPLHGYVASSPKDLAQVILQSGKDDPILAVWQYGLGRSVAFTSDATGRWGRDWVAWPGFATFWAQAVRYSLGEVQNVAIEMDVALEGERARLTLDAFDRAGGFLNGYRVGASIVSPDGRAQELALEQIAPGRYTTQFDPAEQGVYLIRFSGTAVQGGAGFSQTAGWTMTYSPEYRRLDPDPDLLLQLAAVTGGGVATSDPAASFTHNLNAARTTRPLWPWLVLLAAVLLPFDIAVRRLILTRRDLDQLLTKLTAPRPGSALPQPDPRMTTLLRAKDRVRDQAPAAQGPPVQSAEIQPPVDIERAIEDAAAVDRASREPAPVSTTQALLARKKERKGKEERGE